MKPITQIDREQTLKYLGHTGQAIDSQVEALLTSTMEETLALCHPKTVYKVLPIQPEKEQIRIPGSTMALTGKSIAAHLQHCRAAAVMACTLGMAFDRRLKQLENTEVTKAIIMDCCGSAYIEQVCDALEEEILATVQPTHHPFRFSPGYGDLPLSTQRLFQSILLMDKTVGITLTADNLMIPRKSVTAILGFADTALTHTQTKCDTCKLKNACTIRKAGKVCGR